MQDRSCRDGKNIREGAAVIAQAAAHEVERPKDPIAVELGRRGGLKGGRARAEKLSAKRRSQIARKAARTRWKRREQ
jgi:hypothetical protein